MNSNTLANAYTDTHNQTAIVDASPHRQIALLLNKAIERLHQAKGGMDVGDLSRKATCIGKAVDIIDALQGWLNLEQGGQIADNLDALYDYMIRCLHEANLHNSSEKLDEVIRLLGEIKSGWDGIGQEVDG